MATETVRFGRPLAQEKSRMALEQFLPTDTAALIL